jgi:hypothetical protein
MSYMVKFYYIFVSLELNVRFLILPISDVIDSPFGNSAPRVDAHGPVNAGDADAALGSRAAPRGPPSRSHAVLASHGAPACDRRALVIAPHGATGRGAPHVLRTLIIVLGAESQTRCAAMTCTERPVCCAPGLSGPEAPPRRHRAGRGATDWARRHGRGWGF